jgi:hypothetical protein
MVKVPPLVKIPLEMRGMVRYCHPPTPMVGLYRQSNDPARTLQSYKAAKRSRNLVYFPSMLRQMTRNCQTYRLIRRLWIQAIRCILREGCPYLVHTILETLHPKRVEPIPLYFTKYHEVHLSYDQLNVTIRYKQMLGQLVSLGYPDREMFPVDYEYETYLTIFPISYHATITTLYRQLSQQKIEQKWHIVLSHLPKHIHFNLNDWKYQVTSNRLLLMLNAFHRRYSFSYPEYSLLLCWINRLKYPSC